MVCKSCQQSSGSDSLATSNGDAFATINGNEISRNDVILFASLVGLTSGFIQWAGGG